MTLKGHQDFLDSVSKESFQIRPRPTPPVSPRKSKKKSDSTKGSENDPFYFERIGLERLLDGKETPEAMQLRHWGYERTWSQILSSIEKSLLVENSASFNDIVSFVDNSYSSIEIETSFQAFGLPYREIPTALIFTGINSPDNELLFTRIAQRLREAKSNYVVMLQSKDCGSLKMTMKCLNEQVLASMNDFENQDEEMNDADDTDEMTFDVENDKLADGHLQRYDMEVLAEWFEDKRKPNNDDKSLPAKIVILIQDFEAFEPSVLEDFIYICSQYQDRVKFVLLLGIATTINALQQALPSSILNSLRVKKMQLQNSERCLGRIVTAVQVENHIGIKLGKMPYKYLHEVFLLYNYSVSSYMSKLQYAVMHHFFSNPLSILAGIDDQELPSRLSLLSENHLEAIRMQKSFMKYVEAQLPDSDEVRRLLEDNAYLESLLPVLIKGIEQYHKKFSIAFECLWIIQQSLVNCKDPKINVDRKAKHSLYYLAIQEDGGLCDAYHTQKLLVNLKKIDSSCLSDLLQKCLEFFYANHYADPCLAQEVSELENFLVRLCDIEQTFIYENNKGEESSSSTSSTISSTSSRTILSSIKESKNVVIKFSPLIQGEEESTNTLYTILLKQVSEFFDTFFKSNLKHYSTVTLHEVVYYENEKLLKHMFSVHPRAATQKALGQPNRYIKCRCCDYANDEDDEDEEESIERIFPTQQDTCILYKMYLEFGKMINMYDWLMAFKSILERDGPIDEKEVQARFIAGVTELQTLGFVKPTSRKADHFQRLTWAR
ncbi:8493_t:CDS:10 [Ambispora gerdemannii]|uniref:Origin recognition complex subunit 3 n=1 Tax=Ambispora gerdemannii TaxID=144530 RepID=A0A9N9BEN7_9GLOM|nr:8493_t:CDS:10 [Ambispora gerdemannii]